MNILDIKLTYRCNNQCLLCCQNDEIKNDESTIAEETIFEHIENMAYDEIKNTKVVLTGGEPTLHPSILEIVRGLRDKGFETIQLQSNLTLGSLEITMEDLVNSGITSFGVSLHGCTAEMHESFTRTEFSFDNTVAHLNKLSKLETPVAINCVISKFNINSLSDIVMFVVENHLANSIQFAFMHITGRADSHHELIPTISDAAEAVKKAVDCGNKFGVWVKSEAIPFCLMCGYERNVAEVEGLNNIIIFDKLGIMRFSKHREENLKIKCKTCEQCLFFSMCEGPWAEYPLLYGWQEFIPIRSVKPYD